MNNTIYKLMLLCGIIYLATVNIYGQTKPKKTMNTNTTSATSSQRIFIDRFVVPEKASEEFFTRMNINRHMLEKLPGFVEDQIYTRKDEQGNLICITVAIWESEAAIKNAREVVQAEYKKEGFNLPAMLERLNITMSERGIYTRQ